MPTPKKKSAAPARKPAPRKDFGQPIDGFFARQPQPQRAILEALRELVEGVVPDAQASIKWGMPFYTLDGQMMVALGSHKAHVNLILHGPSEAYADPKKILTGNSANGRHLMLRTLEELPPAATVKGWLKTAAKIARGG